MKTIVLLLFVLHSQHSLASACPDLSGQYHCTFKTTAPESLNVSQRQEGGLVIFKLNGNEAIADGVLREMSADEELKNGFYRATCMDGNLRIWQKGDLKFADGYLEATLTLSLNSSGELINESQGKLVVEGRERSLNNTGVCARK